MFSAGVPRPATPSGTPTKRPATPAGIPTKRLRSGGVNPGLSGVAALRERLGLSFHLGLSQLEDLYRYELMAIEDAHEGLRAFAEKRKPLWSNT